MKNNTQSRQKVVLTQSLTDNATQKNTPLGSTSRKEDFNRVQHDIQEKLGKITWTNVLPSDNGSSLVCKSSYIKETLTSEELREIKNILPQGFSIALEQEPTLEKSNY